MLSRKGPFPRVACGLIAAAACLLPASGQDFNRTLSREQARALLQALYAKSDQAYSSQNIAQIDSFLDPSYVYVHPNGLKDSYADIRGRQSWGQKAQSWSPPTQRNIRLKTTIKEVQVRNDGLVASVEWIESYESYESKKPSRPGWFPKLASATQEETWKRTPAGWKLVLTKTSRENTFEAVPLNTLIAHDTQLLEFLCGGSLTAEERRRFAAAITEQFREDPNLWYSSDVEVSQDLRSIRENPGAISAEVWMKWRLRYASATVEGSRILEAHDPIVVFGSNRPVLITEQTLRSLRDAATWVSQHTGRPKPDAQYIANMRNTIRQQWRTWPDDTLSALSFSVKNLPATVEYMLGVLPEAKRAEFFRTWGSGVRGEPQSTIRTALFMSSFYRLLVHEKFRQTIQVYSWSFNRSLQSNFCGAIHPGEGTTGSGPYCSTIQ